MNWDSLWVNARIVMHDHSILENAALAVKDKKIAWIGLKKDLLGSAPLLATEVHDAQNHLITAGLIDCHTHLVYAGNRAKEFEMRLQGESYESIARAGGGIQATVSATRAASEKDLLAQSIARARVMIAEGVTTIEIKSGYGLNLETELKILSVAKQIAAVLPVTVRLTFLGAHSVPEEYKDDPDKYIDLVCYDILPAIAAENLADSIDVFCENIAFNLEQTERVFKSAKEFGLHIKCHAEQLSDMGAAKLAASYQAISVDHLEYLSEESAIALAKSSTAAVLLPGAFYYLRETAMPPINLLRQHQVPMAIATDCNPGTSPTTSLLLMMNMACTLFRLTPEEAFLGVTKHAAKALAMDKTHGSLEVGKAADFVVWDINELAELSYRIAYNPLVYRIYQGELTIGL